MSTFEGLPGPVLAAGSGADDDYPLGEFPPCGPRRDQVTGYVHRAYALQRMTQRVAISTEVPA